MLNFSVPEISVFGVLVLVAGVTIKDIVYDRKKLIGGKVDREDCVEYRDASNKELEYIRGRVDSIYDILIKRRK
jgi:hypothetical protein